MSLGRIETSAALINYSGERDCRDYHRSVCGVRKDFSDIGRRGSLWRYLRPLLTGLSRPMVRSETFLRDARPSWDCSAARRRHLGAKLFGGKCGAKAAARSVSERTRKSLPDDACGCHRFRRPAHRRSVSDGGSGKLPNRKPPPQWSRCLGSCERPPDGRINMRLSSLGWQSLDILRPGFHVRFSLGASHSYEPGSIVS